MKNLSRVTSLLILVLAVNPLDVLINEIAWMGTKTSSADEWIELYNNTGSLINLKGWILKATDGTPEVKSAGSFPANGFYLLERSKDYTGALNNKGEKLELYDNFGNLIDSVDASSGWPAGNNSTKQTMERKGANIWQTSQNPGGTPGTPNSIVVEDKAENKVQPNRELAAVGEPIRQFPLLMALAIAIFSGIIILVLKNKVKIG